MYIYIYDLVDLGSNIAGNLFHKWYTSTGMTMDPDTSGSIVFEVYEWRRLLSRPMRRRKDVLAAQNKNKQRNCPMRPIIWSNIYRCLYYMLILLPAYCKRNNGASGFVPGDMSVMETLVFLIQREI